LVLETVGAETLRDIAAGCAELLGTCCTVYERDGRRSAGEFASEWYRLVDEASRARAGDAGPADSDGASGKSPWQEVCEQAVASEAAVDAEGIGGLRLYALPIRARGEVVGGIGLAYGSPPADPESLRQIAFALGVSPRRLEEAARAQQPCPERMIDLAKRVVGASAGLIGEMVARRLAEQEAESRARGLDARVRELECLHRISRLAEEHRDRLDVLLQAVVEMIPSAWRFPQEACARLRLADREFRTGGFRRTPWSLDAEVRVSGQVAGHLEVCYLRAVPAERSGAFLDSEVALVETIAAELGAVLERDQIRRDLLRNQARYRATFELAGVGIAHVGIDGRFLRVNRRFCQIVGYTRRELRKRTFQEITHPDDVQAGLAYVQRVLAGRISKYTRQKRYVRKNGSIAWVEMTVSAVRTETGEPEYLISVITDISARKQAEQQARQAQEELLRQRRHEMERVQEELAKARDELVRKTRLATIGQVLGSMAHDLRNPLGAARNAIYYLKRHFARDPERTAAYLDIVDQEITAADLIISNLLGMARSKAPVKRAVDLGRAIEEVLRTSLGSERIGWQVSLEPDPFLVHADPDLLRQVLRNLVKNAVQAMGSEGRVEVRAVREGGWDTIAFCDTGPGVPQHVRETLFEPLVTTKPGGTGLGLAICRQVLESHGGSIELVGPPGGSGATFRIRLPRP